MKNKIIKIYDINLKKLKSGGGTPILEAPKDIKKLEQLLLDLKKIEPFTSKKAFALIHNKKSSIIPAPSNRFIEAMTMIFGDNKFLPKKTRYNKTNKTFDFLYEVEYKKIQEAIKRLNSIINIITENLKKYDYDYENFFKKIIEEDKKNFQNFIKMIATKNEYKIFSYTKFINIFSRQYKTFESFKNLSENVKNEKNEMSEISFVSNETKEKAIAMLERKRVKIFYENEYDINFEGNFEANLKGLIDFKKNIKKQFVSFYDKKDKNESKKLEDAIYSKFQLKENEKNNIKIGVIDGGIPNDSIVKRDLYRYYIPKDIGFNEDKPIGNHAEEVTSLLLWANKLSIEDNCTSPLIILFDVIGKYDTKISFKKKLEKIIAEHSHEIKIWNLSINFPYDKHDEAISSGGVFLDYLQKKYNILFFIAAGNIIEDEKSDKIISSPSDSFKGFCISSVNKNNKFASYSKQGYGFLLNQKPDLSTNGGDNDYKIKVIKNNSIYRSNGGTSFAVPLIVRKAAFLMTFNFSILEIPAILNTYAAWNAHKNQIEKNDYKKIGNGFLPIDIKEMMNLINKKSMVVFKNKLDSSYHQAFLDIKLPIFEGKFDFSIFVSINVDGTLANYSTYEYVFDSTRITFGKIDPYDVNGKKINNVLEPHLNFEDIENNWTELSLRVYKGKFKTRQTLKHIIKRARSSTKKGKKIKKWGIKFIRDMIGITRKEAKNQNVAVCFIFISKGNDNFYNEFINLNRNYISNINEIEFENTLSDEINFE